MMDSYPSSLFKISIFHLDSLDIHAMVHHASNHVPYHIDDSGWMLRWEVSMRRIVKFNCGWGCMISHKHR